MRIFLKNAYCFGDIEKIKSSGEDLFIINYHKTIFVSPYCDISNGLRAALLLSDSARSDVLLHARLAAEGEELLSTIFIHTGKIAGIAGCIGNRAVRAGSALKMYKICDAWVGIAVDCDMLCAGVNNFFYAGASVVIHNSLNAFDKRYYRAYRAHDALCSGYRVGLFKDAAIISHGGLTSVGERAELNLEGTESSRCEGFLKLIKYNKP